MKTSDKLLRPRKCTAVDYNQNGNKYKKFKDKVFSI